TAQLDVYDETAGNTLVATIRWDAHGDGPFLACVPFATNAVRTIRLERPTDDGGGAAGFCRTLLVCGDQAGLAPELLLGKFAKGGENIPDWEPVFTPTPAFPYGRHMHPFTLVSVAAGTGETGLQGGV